MHCALQSNTVPQIEKDTEKNNKEGVMREEGEKSKKKSRNVYQHRGNVLKYQIIYFHIVILS